MTILKSDLSIAQQHATNLQEASTKIEFPTNITIDRQTNLQGNQHAHFSIEEAILLSQNIANTFKEASVHLKTVAQEFEAVDQKSAENFRNHK